MLAPHGRTDEHYDGRTDRREHYVGTARTEGLTDGRTDEHYVGTARTD